MSSSSSPLSVFAYLQQNPSRLAWFCKSEQLFMLCPLNDGQELGAGPANQIGQGVAPSPWRYCYAGLPPKTLISCRRQITAIHSELAPLLPPPGNGSSRSVTKVSRCVICMWDLILHHDQCSVQIFLTRSRRGFLLLAMGGHIVLLAEHSISMTTLIGENREGIRWPIPTLARNLYKSVLTFNHTFLNQ